MGKENIKIRYVFKHRKTAEIQYRYANIQEIENGILDKFKVDLVEFNLIARDRSIGMTDNTGQEIYENDVDELGWVVSYVESDSSSCGLELGWYLERDNFESFGLIEYACNKCGKENSVKIVGTIYDEIGRIGEK